MAQADEDAGDLQQEHEHEPQQEPIKRFGANTCKPKPAEPTPVPSCFFKGQTVHVAERTGMGQNKPGGVGRITKVHPEDGSCDIKYSLGGRELRVLPCYLSEWNAFAQDSSRNAAAPARFVAKPASYLGNPEDKRRPGDEKPPLFKAIVSGSVFQPAAMGEYLGQRERHSVVGEYFRSENGNLLYFHPQRKRWYIGTSFDETSTASLYSLNGASAPDKITGEWRAWNNEESTWSSETSITIAKVVIPSASSSPLKREHSDGEGSSGAGTGTGSGSGSATKAAGKPKKAKRRKVGASKKQQQQQQSALRPVSYPTGAFDPEKEGFCSFCEGGDASADNPIIFCDCCAVGVHQRCYGVQSVPDGPWMCDLCVSTGAKSSTDAAAAIAGADAITCPNPKANPSAAQQCALCLRTGLSYGGAFKRSETGDWCHLVCAYWIPELYSLDQPVLQGHAKAIAAERCASTCQVCGIHGGVPVYCAAGKCREVVHVACARAEGLKMVQDFSKGKLRLKVFCRKHSKPRARAPKREQAEGEGEKTKSKRKSKSAKTNAHTASASSTTTSTSSTAARFSSVEAGGCNVVKVESSADFWRLYDECSAGTGAGACAGTGTGTGAGAGQDGERCRALEAFKQGQLYALRAPSACKVKEETGMGMQVANHADGQLLPVLCILEAQEQEQEQEQGQGQGEGMPTAREIGR
eukprot:g1152.t1